MKREFSGNFNNEDTSITEKLSDNAIHCVWNEDPEPHDPDLLTSNQTELDFGFQLDYFQKESIRAINSGDSVLVIASTSAGKSVVAYHAISKSIEQGFKAIYTSPVKSLANQKFLELCSKFDSVGLITGDTTENPSASILIMTAEVLRNQLLSHSSLISGVKHIILDEFHYLGDLQRGVVWEEIVIALPSTTRLVCLTATLPNHSEIARWIFKCTKVPIHVVVQTKRPVPLRIFALVQSSKSPILLKDGNDPLDYKRLNEACNISQLAQNSQKGMIGLQSKKWNLPRDPPASEIANRTIQIMNAGKTPLIVFCLSRHRCETIAKSLLVQLSQIHFSGGFEAQMVFDSAAEDWPEDLQHSQQLQLARDLAGCGIGVHHSGILPVIRELVEVLFQKGKLLVLVATETFALGVNGPARAVLFGSLVKWGGEFFRSLSPTEFMQMAGRAGRRGIDTEGEVYVCPGNESDPSLLSKILCGRPQKLKSQMRISSSLILSCSQMNLNPHDFISNSLMKFQLYSKFPKLIEKLIPIAPVTAFNMLKNAKTFDQKTIKNLILKIPTKFQEIEAMKIESETVDGISKYMNIAQQITNICILSQNAHNILTKGRLIFISAQNGVWGWTSIQSVDFKEKIVHVITIAVKNELDQFIPYFENKSLSENPQLINCSFPLSAVSAVAGVTLQAMLISKASVFIQTLEKIKTKCGEIPLINADPITYMKDKVIKLFNEMQTIQKQLNKHDIISNSSSFYNKIKLVTKAENALTPIYDNRIEDYKALLIEFGYLNQDSLIEIKGRVGACISVDDPLPLTELLFSSFFESLDTDSIIITISSFVESPPRQTQKHSNIVDKIWNDMKKQLKHLEDRMNAHNIPPLELPKKNLMYFVSDALKNCSMDEATEHFEGISQGFGVRVLKRLKELLLQLENAANVMCVNEIAKKFHASTERLIELGSFEISLYKSE